MDVHPEHNRLIRLEDIYKTYHLGEVDVPVPGEARDGCVGHEGDYGRDGGSGLCALSPGRPR